MHEELEGWRESINDGLASPDIFCGVPTRFFCFLAVPSLGFSALLHSWGLFVIAVALYALAAALTRWDPFWPGVLWDWLRMPDVIDP